MKVGREDEARYILGRLRGDSNSEDIIRADSEFRDILNIAELEQSISHNHSYWAMLFGYKSGKLHLGRRVQLVIWLQIMQEWVGIAGVTVCMSFDRNSICRLLTISLRCADYFLNCRFQC